MKRLSYFISLILLCFYTQAPGQSHAIDSIQKVLKTAKEDTNKVNALNFLAFSISNSNPDSTILLAQQAGVLASKLGFTRGEANANRNTGIGYGDKDDYPRAIEYDTKALKIFREMGDKPGQVSVLSSMGVIYYNQGDYPKAIDNDEMAFNIGEELGNKQMQASALGNIGIVYYGQGNYPKALDYYLKALKIKEELGNKRGQANTLCNIGIIYDDEGDYSKALDYYLKALKIDEELGNEQGQAADLTNIGIENNEEGDFSKALDCYSKALKIDEELGNKFGQAYALGNIGGIYLEMAIRGNQAPAGKDTLYKKALEYYLNALKITEEIGDKRGIASHLGNIGTLYTKTGKFKEAEACLKKAIALDSSIGEQNYLKNNDENLSQLYDTIGQYKLALVYYRKAMALKDTLFNIDKNKALTRKELTYEFDKKQAAEKAEQDKKDALADADKRKQTIIIWSTIAGLLLVMVFAGFIFRSLRTTRKQKDIIEIKNKETEEQKKVIEEKNKDIIDSINYAKRLQEAILPPLSLIKQTLPESFVLYKPKDIVAGDFYWMERVTSLNLSQGRDFERSQPGMPSPLGEGQDEVILIAAADCTGHGVPGALVSVVCSNALNRAVKEFGITDPGKILDKVRELVLETFEKSEDNVQDGMDISLCAITFPSPRREGTTVPSYAHSSDKAATDASLPLGREGVRVDWAGANNSLWYIENNEIKELTADKQHIGQADNPKPFTTHTITLYPPLEGREAATLYLFTDGYADQFGGPKGKKFRYAQFQEKLLAISHEPLAEQKKILEKTFEEWKGELEQVDDILIIGIRV